MICRVTKHFEFETAHKLKKSYNEDCMKNIHGHTYKLEVTVQGELNEDGMVIDFKKLNEIVKEKIVKVYDHALVLTEDDPLIELVRPHIQKLVIYKKNSTAERMCIEMYNIIKNCEETKDKQIHIKLFETSTSFAEFGDLL